MCLLLIEDHAPLRDAVGQYLREAGYLVDTAATGDEGLWAAEGGGHDLVLLDLMLPNMDGMEILRRLRAKGNPLHVIVLSARDGLEDRLEAKVRRSWHKAGGFRLASEGDTFQPPHPVPVSRVLTAAASSAAEEDGVDTKKKGRGGRRHYPQ